MLQEAIIFRDSDRFFIDRAIIDAVALPVGDNYGDDVFTDYFSLYSGVAKKYKPKRVFEIGVRYGYCALAMQLGMRHNQGRPRFMFRGIDDESYHFGSCARANENFAAVCPWADMQAIKYNSITQGLPTDFGTWDLIHIDGNHDHGPVAGDLELAWPVLNQGGIIMLDDAKPTMDDGRSAPIYNAIQDFLCRFEHTDNKVEWQLCPSLTYHFFIRKVS